MIEQAISSVFKPYINEMGGELQGKSGKTREEVEQNIKAVKLHKLSSNENPLGPSPKAVAAIQAHLAELNEYGYRTDDKLREALSAHFQHQISPEQFVTTNGGVEFLELVARSFLGPGLECIYSNPTFYVYEVFAKLNGAKAVNVPLLQGSFDVDVNGILDAVNENTRLIFLANPNNPTGTIIPRKDVETILQNIPDHVIVVHDEVYYNFVESPDFPHVVDYIKKGQNVIGLHSFSKSYGLAGLRLGYAYSTPEIAHYLRNNYRPFLINTLTYEGGLAALQDEEHLQKSVKLVSEEKKWLYEQFRLLGIRYWESHANFVLFVSPRPDLDLVSLMLQDGIMIRPGDTNGAAGTLRVTIGTHESMEAFVASLQRRVKSEE